MENIFSWDAHDQAETVPELPIFDHRTFSRPKVYCFFFALALLFECYVRNFKKVTDNVASHERRTLEFEKKSHFPILTAS